MLLDLEEKTRVLIEDIVERSAIGRGAIFVLGLSSSEVAGGTIGKASSREIGQRIVKTILEVLEPKGIYLAVQGCEHLNRAIIIEKAAAKEYRLPMVNVVPKLKAGGSFATAVYAALQAPVAVEAIQASYDNDKTDEFVIPTVIKKDGQPVGTVKANDSVIFFNFRPDRAREITRAMCDPEFTGFERRNGVFPLTYVCFTEYDETIPNKSVAFKKEEITNTFGEYLAAHNMTQARIAETEKYAHVTFFFNGGVEEPNEGEDRILVPSPKEVPTYDLKPEMSAPIVCDKLVEAIESGKYDVIIINFANPDMVGHTGVESAAIKAIETVDACVGRAVEAIKAAGGVLFICADHGNAEVMVDEATGEPWTAHTTNQVPFVLVGADPAYKLREGGRLCDIVPTLIELMGLEKPKEMTGESLLVK